jgi:hypothetical protein
MTDAPQSPARSKTGRIRNVKAMGDETLKKLYAEMQAFGEEKDPEAALVVVAELQKRRTDEPAADLPVDVASLDEGSDESPVEDEKPALSARRQRIVNEVREYAKRPENYEKGWDVIVEATDDGELAELTGKTRTFDAARKRVARYVRLRRSVAEDVRAA